MQKVRNCLKCSKNKRVSSAYDKFEKLHYLPVEVWILVSVSFVNLSFQMLHLEYYQVVNLFFTMRNKQKSICYIVPFISVGALHQMFVFV